MTFQVDYADTDAMGIAHHASYFRWFERARVEWLRSLGVPYHVMEQEGYYLPLRSAAIEYHRSLKFDDQPSVEVIINKIRMAGVDLDYRIVLGPDLITKATSSHVICSKRVENGKIIWSPVRLPEKWRKIWLEQIEKK